jgi:hypothetical protein
MSSYCGLEALMETSTDESIEKDGTVRMVALFDNVSEVICCSKLFRKR